MRGGVFTRSTALPALMLAEKEAKGMGPGAQAREVYGPLLALVGLLGVC